MKIRIGLLIAVLAAAMGAAAYEYPISPYSIREAYFLGRRKDEKTAVFLAQYVRRLPLTKQGPHVAEIELRTPYQQVVLRARQAPDGYSSQQAAQEYRKQPSRILVRVKIYLTPTYPAHSPIAFPGLEPVRVRRDDFWRDFSFCLIQEEELQPKRITGRPIYAGDGLPGLVGADVELEFEADDVASAPARVQVLTPDGERVEAEFDLVKLR